MILAQILADLHFETFQAAQTWVLARCHQAAGTWIGGWMDARDLAQDVWIELLKLPADKRITRAFVGQTIDHRYADRVRHHMLVMRREDRVLESLYAAVTVAADHQTQALARELADLYSALRERLAPDAMEVLSLRLEGYSQQEIATKMGMSSATVCRREQEATAVLRMLAQGIDPNDDDPSKGPRPPRGAAPAPRDPLPGGGMNPVGVRRRTRGELASLLLDRLAEASFCNWTEEVCFSEDFASRMAEAYSPSDLASCRGADTESTGEIVLPTAPSVLVIFVDPEGNRIPGAWIQRLPSEMTSPFQGQSADPPLASTDSEGVVLQEALPVGREQWVIGAPGFVTRTIDFMLDSDTRTCRTLRLTRCGTPAQVDTTIGVDLPAGNALVRLPPGPMINKRTGELVTGMVQAHVTVVNPSDGVDAPPIPLVGRSLDDTTTQLESWGMVGVDLTDMNGNPVELHDDVFATVSIELSDEMSAQIEAQGLTSIPAWHADPTNGDMDWQEIGEFTLEKNDAGRYVATTYKVKKFSWINMDSKVPEPRCYIIHVTDNGVGVDLNVYVKTDGTVIEFPIDAQDVWVPGSTSDCGDEMPWLSVGICKPAQRICEDGKAWSECSAPVVPQFELYLFQSSDEEDLDVNCDGNVNDKDPVPPDPNWQCSEFAENYECYPGNPNDLGPSMKCDFGMQVCEYGHWSFCVGATTPNLASENCVDDSESCERKPCDFDPLWSNSGGLIGIRSTLAMRFDCIVSHITGGETTSYGDPDQCFKDSDSNEDNAGWVHDDRDFLFFMMLPHPATTEPCDEQFAAFLCALDRLDERAEVYRHALEALFDGAEVSPIRDHEDEFAEPQLASVARLLWGQPDLPAPVAAHAPPEPDAPVHDVPGEEIRIAGTGGLPAEHDGPDVRPDRSSRAALLRLLHELFDARALGTWLRDGANSTHGRQGIHRNTKNDENLSPAVIETGRRVHFVVHPREVRANHAPLWMSRLQAVRRRRESLPLDPPSRASRTYGAARRRPGLSSWPPTEVHGSSPPHRPSGL